MIVISLSYCIGMGDVNMKLWTLAALDHGSITNPLWSHLLYYFRCKSNCDFVSSHSSSHEVLFSDFTAMNAPKNLVIPDISQWVLNSKPHISTYFNTKNDATISKATSRVQTLPCLRVTFRRCTWGFGSMTNARMSSQTSEDAKHCYSPPKVPKSTPPKPDIPAPGASIGTTNGRHARFVSFQYFSGASVRQDILLLGL